MHAHKQGAHLAALAQHAGHVVHALGHERDRVGLQLLRVREHVCGGGVVACLRVSCAAGGAQCELQAAMQAAATVTAERARTVMSNLARSGSKVMHVQLSLGLHAVILGSDVWCMRG
jgi:hypothetical protein